MLPGDALKISFGATRCQIDRKTMFLEGPEFWPYPWLGLACLSFLASDRPRSPCLHLATTARPARSAGAVVPGAGKASEADPRVSTASRGLARKPIHTTTTTKLRRSCDDLATKLRRPCDDLANEADVVSILCRFGTENDPTCSGPRLFVETFWRTRDVK